MPPIKATSKSATTTSVLQLELAFRAFEDLAFTTVTAIRHFSFISLTATITALKQYPTSLTLLEQLFPNRSFRFQPG